MLGIPGESKKEIEQTIDLAKNLNLDYVQFSIATAYPRTELYQIVQRQGKLSKNFLAGFYALGQQKGIVSLCDIDPKVLQRYLKRAYWSFYFRLTYIWQRIANIKSLNDLNLMLPFQEQNIEVVGNEDKQPYGNPPPEGKGVEIYQPEDIYKTVELIGKRIIKLFTTDKAKESTNLAILVRENKQGFFLQKHLQNFITIYDKTTESKQETCQTISLLY